MADTVTVPPAPGDTDRGSPGLVPKLLRGALDAFLRRREASVLLVAIGVMVYFQASTPIFLTEGNLRNIAQATGPTAIVAAGIVLLLVSGEIDLSVGIVAAFAPFLMHFAIDLVLDPGDPGHHPGPAHLGRHRVRQRVHLDRAEGALVRHHAGHVLSALRRAAAAPPAPTPRRSRPRRRAPSRPGWARATGPRSPGACSSSRSSTSSSPAPAGACTPSRSAATCSARPRPASGSTGSRSATS